MWTPPRLESLDESEPRDATFTWSFGVGRARWETELSALAVYRIVGFLLIINVVAITIRYGLTHVPNLITHTWYGRPRLSRAYVVPLAELGYAVGLLSGNGRIEAITPVRALAGLVAAAAFAFGAQWYDEAIRQVVLAVALMVIVSRRATPGPLKIATIAVTLCAVTSVAATLLVI